MIEYLWARNTRKAPFKQKSKLAFNLIVCYYLRKFNIDYNGEYYIVSLKWRTREITRTSFKGVSPSSISQKGAVVWKALN